MLKNILSQLKRKYSNCKIKLEVLKIKNAHGSKKSCNNIYVS